MRKNVRLNRRQVLGVTAGTLTVGLAGCLGGGGDDSDDSGGDGNNAEDDGSDSDSNETDEDGEDTAEVEGPRELSELSDQEIIDIFKEDFVTALNSGDVEKVKRMFHSESDLGSLSDQDSSFYGPQFEIENVTITSRTEDKIDMEAIMSYELDGNEFEETWEIEIRPENYGLAIWNIESDQRNTQPAVSPEVAVSEFVTALNDGETETVDEMFHKDAYIPETIKNQPENYEGIIELVNTEILERKNGEATVEATVQVTGGGETQELIWELELTSVDSSWKIGFKP
jgi:hypothetical protein